MKLQSNNSSNKRRRSHHNFLQKKKVLENHPFLISNNKNKKAPFLYTAYFTPLFYCFFNTWLAFSANTNILYNITIFYPLSCYKNYLYCLSTYHPPQLYRNISEEQILSLRFWRTNCSSFRFTQLGGQSNRHCSRANG